MVDDVYGDIWLILLGFLLFELMFVLGVLCMLIEMEVG